jgi:fructose-1,6-bisphosphatase I
MSKVITIERHIIEQERVSKGATGDFSAMLRDLTLAIKIIRYDEHTGRGRSEA